jgi:hypothetical protein
MPTPTFDDDPSLLQSVKKFAIEQFVAHSGIEAFNVSVLPRIAWCDAGSLRSNGVYPCLYSLGDELRTIVGTNKAWHATQNEQIRQHIDNARTVETPIDTDRQTFARIFMDNIEHADLTAIMRAILHEVVDQTWFGCSARNRIHDPSLSHKRLRFGCLLGTFSPARRQMRSTRLSLTCQPDRLSNSAIRR